MGSTFKSTSILFLLGLPILLAFTAHRHAPTASVPRDLCDVYGLIYVDSTGLGPVDYSVYLEESEFSADYVIFLEENPLFADRTGIWHFTNDRFLADFIVRPSRSSRNADFKIFFTPYEDRAGCP